MIFYPILYIYLIISALKVKECNYSIKCMETFFFFYINTCCTAAFETLSPKHIYFMCYFNLEFQIMDLTNTRDKVVL